MSENSKLQELKSVMEELTQEGLSFMEKMELKDKELELKRELNLITPPDDPEDCLNCSA